jgi:hypothetical protein
MIREAPIRRFLLVAIAVLASRAAMADPLSDVCNRLIGTETTRCLSAAGGRFVNASAVRECGRLIGSQVTACVGAVAGKDYTPGEASACGGMIGSEVTECFRKTGHPHVDRRAPPAPSNAEIRAELAAAIEQIRGGDVKAADLRLSRLLDRMR